MYVYVFWWKMAQSSWKPQRENIIINSLSFGKEDLMCVVRGGNNTFRQNWELLRETVGKINNV